MKNIKYTVILVLSLIALVSCETTDLDKQNNPNALSPNNADIDLTMNAIMVRTGEFTNTMGSYGSRFTRIRNMFGRNYLNVFGPANFNGAWNQAYADILNDIRSMNEQIDGLEGNFDKHKALGEIFEAYIIVTLVDYFGKIPYSEALNPEILNPKLDDGEEVYGAALTLLDNAIAKLKEPTVNDVGTDLYYDGDYEKWEKLANTLKMKILFQQRLVAPSSVDQFKTIVSTGNYIEEGEDFVFNWGDNLDNPNSRHPIYNVQYAPGGPDTWYMSNWLMDQMRNGQATEDPRIRYYFYRQVDDVVSNVDPDSGSEKRCIIQTIPPHYDDNNILYCYPNNNRGLWGRDHGQDDGIPPDGFFRSAFGLYPAGGRFDDSSFEIIDGNNYGANGAGITPILLASTVDFWRAELALEEDNDANAASGFLKSGMEKHIAYVQSFTSRSSAAFEDTTVPSSSEVSDYIDEVVDEFENASAEKQLNIIGEQFFISLIGNGTDAYNFYRRTGAPTDIQPSVEPDPGPLPRTLWYPASEVTANSKVSQKEDLTPQVFWDNNPSTGFPVSN